MKSNRVCLKCLSHLRWSILSRYCFHLTQRETQNVLCVFFSPKLSRLTLGHRWLFVYPTRPSGFSNFVVFSLFKVGPQCPHEGVNQCTCASENIHSAGWSSFSVELRYIFKPHRFQESICMKSEWTAGSSTPWGEVSSGNTRRSHGFIYPGEDTRPCCFICLKHSPAVQVISLYFKSHTVASLLIPV